MTQLINPKVEKTAEIISAKFTEKMGRILVVGCGDGTEAAILAQKLEAEVVGLDVNDDFSVAAQDYATLLTGDAQDLGFTDETFDFVYSFHALEHIADPRQALMEMKRVMKKGAGFWIGTPNKSRLVGYIGSRNASLRQKIKWNLEDWQARLGNRFENNLGAHAGFIKPELKEMLVQAFSEVEDASLAYYLKIYPRYHKIINFLEKSRVAKFAYPSIYFYGRK